MDKMKKLKNNFWWIVVSILLVGLIFAEEYYINLFKDTGIIHLHAFLIILITFGIFSVAWIQLSGIRKTAKDEFLLEVDKRYSSTEIMEARVILQEFYCATRREGLKDGSFEHNKLISEEITATWKKKDASKKFIRLMNFLYLLETMAYFCNNNHISGVDIKELLGGSMKRNFEWFEELIYKFQKKNSKDCYKEIIKFCKVTK